MLPLNLKNYMQTFNHELFHYGILSTVPGAEKYFFNGYIHTFFDTESNQFFITDERETTGFDKPLLSEYIPKSRFFEIKKTPETLWDYCRSAISEEYYVTGIFDEYYIPHRWAYQKSKFFHDYLIIGCDDGKYQITGYDDRGTVSIIHVSKEEMYNSIQEIEDENTYKVKINPNYQHNDDFYNIYRLLRIYNLGGKSVTSHNVYGIDTSKAFSHYIRHFDAYEMGGFDNRFFRSYFEHKRLMYERFIYHKCTLDIQDTILNKLSENYKNAEKMLMMSVKYNMTKDGRILNSIVEKLENIWLNENDVMSDLIRCVADKLD